MNVWTRRRMLEAAVVGGGSVILPVGRIFAQGATSLLRAPRQALVIGNSKYKHAPLKNPVNDAQGMAAALKIAGFAVTIGLELSQSAIQEAIRAYTDNLAKAKAVGLFYFAGHGAQLAWRNYLIPVDADIVNAEELRQRGVDVNSLIAGIRKAGNPMNIVILDACRDDPFGGSSRLDQKGLSQLDAPPGTLLAYATAPGNTAIDGEGENGLYTEHLLREIRVPETKVEDVFKRVRLGVRLRSKGLQVPWESTSLEDDFWFVPPKELQKLADAELERQFKEELTLWERIKTSIEPEPLESYLRRFPSGRYTELAQFRLDQLLAKMGEKKVEIVSAPENPYSKGTAKTNTAFRIGDTYTYRTFDLLTKMEGRRFVRTVTAITDDEVVVNGVVITDLLGNVIRSPREPIAARRQIYVAEYSIGKKWSSRHMGTGVTGQPLSYEYNFKVVAKEKKTVPAGSFDAYRVEGLGYSSANSRLQFTYWMAPDHVNRAIASETLSTTFRGVIYTSEGEELVSYARRG